MNGNKPNYYKGSKKVNPSFLKLTRKNEYWSVLSLILVPNHQYIPNVEDNTSILRERGIYLNTIRNYDLDMIIYIIHEFWIEIRASF